jgi:hypothetical protein
MTASELRARAIQKRSPVNQLCTLMTLIEARVAKMGRARCLLESNPMQR